MKFIHNRLDSAETHKIFTFVSDDGTGDSLDIKPPQAKSEQRYKDRKKHKKHSHDRKYKHRDYEKDDEFSRKSSHYDESKNYYREREEQQHYRRDEHRPETSRGRRMSPEKLEEDLRNRLLLRRNQKDDYEPKGSRKDDYYERKERSKEYYEKERKEFDDDETYERVKRHHRHHKQIDPEAEARRRKFLEFDREDERRKEQGRQQLEARREHRNKEHQSRDVSLSPPDKKKKRVDSPAKSDVVMLSSEHSRDDDDEDVSEPESKSSKKQRSENQSESDFEMSPISVEQLEKSDRRKSKRATHSRSKSRSHSRSRSSSSSRSHSRSSSRSSHTSETGSDEDSDSNESERDEEAGKKAANSTEQDDKTNKTQSAPPVDDPSKRDDEKLPEPVVEEEEEVLPPYYPALQGCRSVEEFQCLNRIEEGTYGVVYRARDKRTDEVVALKRLKMEKEKEGFPITSLREINTLLKGQHPNIVTVREIVVGSNMDKIFIVMDYVEHDLKSLIETMKHKRQVFLPGEVKCLIQQLLRAVAHLHDNWILHRDLKTSNLLLSHKGILKVGDFGLAREYGSPLKEYTSIVVTLWYRAPELLLGCREYSCPIDVWSCGCIFAELLSMAALFPGKSEVDQLNRIFKDLGTPNERIWPGYDQLPLVKKMTFTDYPVSQIRKKFSTHTSELGMSMLLGLLTYDPKQRLTAESALKHSYFKELPLPIDPAMFPTWPAKSEVGWKRAIATSPKPPSGGGQFKKLVSGSSSLKI